MPLGGSVPPIVEPERRVDVGHQRRVDGDTEGPTVHPEHEVVERFRVTAGEEQHHAGEEDEQANKAAAAVQPVDPASRPGAANEHADDEVVRDCEQPPLDEHHPARQRVGVGDLEPGRPPTNRPHG